MIQTNGSFRAALFFFCDDDDTRAVVVVFQKARFRFTTHTFATTTFRK